MAKAKTKKSTKVKKVENTEVETTEEVNPEKRCRQSAPSTW